MNNNAQQQYQNQEEILAEQKQLLLRQQQQQLNQQQPQPSAPVLSESELAMQQQHQQQQQMMSEEQRQRYQSHLQLQLNQISAANAMGMQQFLHQAADNMMNMQARQHHDQPPPAKYQRNFVDGDFEFVSGQRRGGNCELPVDLFN